MDEKFRRTKAKKGAPNILLVNVDQWAGPLLGCAGSEILTPTLDAMCRIGTRYDNAYSTTPVCIPARREILCGCDSKAHGDRTFQIDLELPSGIPTIAEVFSSAGYQTVASGKLHVHPQRCSAGFDNVWLMEEGRHYGNVRFDDYERYLMLNGHTGEEYGHCMCNNDYMVNPWHLNEQFHPTNWITRQMCESIMRRDATKPGFWYLSYNHPHPPLAPLQKYMDLYRDIEISEPTVAAWADDYDNAPAFCKEYWGLFPHMNDKEMIRRARIGYYALCTHIDHQIRLVLGTLREEDLLTNTAIVFISDHGEMLGTHRLWQKNVFYENSTRVPMIIVPPVGCNVLDENAVDHRLVELRDIMPTLLDIAGIPIPPQVNGMSLLKKDGKESCRDYVYGELWEDIRSSRMIRKGDYKLIYSPYDNKSQLFNLAEDPMECNDLSPDNAYTAVKKEMTDILASRLYGQDLGWLRDGKLIGCDSVACNTNVLGKHDFLLQRGLR